MIITENINIDGKDFKYTKSDSGFKIQKIGTDEVYDEAYDVQDFNYVEIEEMIENA